MNALKSDFLRNKEQILREHGDEPCDSDICPMCLIREDQTDFSHWRKTTQEMINNF